jgi:hypothetical protein
MLYEGNSSRVIKHHGWLLKSSVAYVLKLQNENCKMGQVDNCDPGRGSAQTDDFFSGAKKKQINTSPVGRGLGEGVAE